VPARVQVMRLPCALAGVSSAVQDVLSAEFGRTAQLIPNGIDCQRFCPGPRVGAVLPAVRRALGASGAAGARRGAMKGGQCGVRYRVRALG
jgi:hypothetical protein